MKKSQLRTIIREEIQKIKEFHGYNDEIPSEILFYLDDKIDIPEDIEHGESYSEVLEKAEHGNEEWYYDAELFYKAEDYIKSQGGSITLEGNPDALFTIDPKGIRYSLTQSLI